VTCSVPDNVNNRTACGCACQQTDVCTAYKVHCVQPTYRSSSFGEVEWGAGAVPTIQFSFPFQLSIYLLYSRFRPSFPVSVPNFSIPHDPLSARYTLSSLIHTGLCGELYGLWNQLGSGWNPRPRTSNGCWIISTSENSSSDEIIASFVAAIVFFLRISDKNMHKPKQNIRPILPWILWRLSGLGAWEGMGG